MSYLDIVMEILAEAEKPLTLNEILERHDKLNYDRVRSSLTKAKNKHLISQKRINHKESYWRITAMGLLFVNRPKKTVEM